MKYLEGNTIIPSQKQNMASSPLTPHMRVRCYYGQKQRSGALIKSDHLAPPSQSPTCPSTVISAWTMALARTVDRGNCSNLSCVTALPETLQWFPIDSELICMSFPCPRGLARTLSSLLCSFSLSPAPVHASLATQASLPFLWAYLFPLRKDLCTSCSLCLESFFPCSHYNQFLLVLQVSAHMPPPQRSPP